MKIIRAELKIADFWWGDRLTSELLIRYEDGTERLIELSREQAQNLLSRVGAEGDVDSDLFDTALMEILL